MLNQVVLVGRVLQLPILKETQAGVKLAEMLVEIERSFKNAQGETETDVIQCTLWRGLAESALEQCTVGSLVGIKGRLQANSFETKDKGIFYSCEVIAEKISFLNPQP